MPRQNKSSLAAEGAVYRYSIKDWPEGERPREKMLTRGAEALSDAELLALLINSGSGKRSALDIARDLLSKHGNVRTLSKRQASELKKENGIGPARAVIIMAAFELGRRNSAIADDTDPGIGSPEDVARRYIPKLRDLTTERFFAILLNNSGKIIREVQISEGTVNASLVHQREVFKAAVSESAVAVILVHNHPSGVRTPSAEDIEITKHLVQAGKWLDIPIRDHIIVCGNSYISFLEEGLL
jgi:DNA repair protein RadC